MTDQPLIVPDHIETAEDFAQLQRYLRAKEAKRDAAQVELARLRGELEAWRDELNNDESDATNTNVVWRRVNRILDPAPPDPDA